MHRPSTGLSHTRYLVSSRCRRIVMAERYHWSTDESLEDRSEPYPTFEMACLAAAQSLGLSKDEFQELIRFGDLYDLAGTLRVAVYRYDPVPGTV